MEEPQRFEYVTKNNSGLKNPPRRSNGTTGDEYETGLIKLAELRASVAPALDERELAALVDRIERALRG